MWAVHSLPARQAPLQLAHLNTVAPPRIYMDSARAAALIEQLGRRVSSGNPAVILGVTPWALRSDIDEAFNVLCVALHPSLTTYHPAHLNSLRTGLLLLRISSRVSCP